MGNDIFLTEIDMPCMLQPNRDSSDLFFGSLNMYLILYMSLSPFALKTGEMVNDIMPQNTNVDQVWLCVWNSEVKLTQKEWEMITQSYSLKYTKLNCP